MKQALFDFLDHLSRWELMREELPGVYPGGTTATRWYIRIR